MFQMKFVYNFICVNLIIGLIRAQLFTSFNLPQWELPDTTKLDDDRLILTPFLDACDDMTARKIARVNKTLFFNVTSYSGYLTVDEQHNSNLFFWFFPAEGTEHLYEESTDYDDGEDEDSDYDHPFLKKLVKRPKVTDLTRLDEDKPVVLWLQGGPGSSSLFGLFTENGPFFIDEKNSTKIKVNPYSWHRNYSMLFIDNPVGTGFSYTNPEGYTRNIPQVAKHLYKGLVQFFNMFPFLKSNDFFITGESFAGKYIPAIGNEIYEENRKDHGFKINLQGLALGNALSDPYNMIDYSDFVYQLGLVGLLGHREMKLSETLFKAYYDSPIAKSYWDGALFSFLWHSNYSNLYNIQQPNALDLNVFLDFINLPQIRKALHVGNQEFADPTTVYLKLVPDFLTTAMHWTEKLLNAGMRIMYYSGNWDFIVAYPLSENAYQKMKWKGADKYRTARRRPFYVNNTLKGYVTKADNFIEATILNAGHMVPTDQPEACLALIDKFIKNLL